MLNRASPLFAGLLGLTLSVHTAFAQNTRSGNLDTLPEVADEFEIKFVALAPLNEALIIFRTS